MPRVLWCFLVGCLFCVCLFGFLCFDISLTIYLKRVDILMHIINVKWSLGDLSYSS